MSKTDLTVESLLEGMTSGAALIDAHGQVVYANPQFADWIGKPESDIVGQPWCALLRLPPKTDCALCLGANTAMATGHAAVHGGFLLVATGADEPEEFRVKIKHSALAGGLTLSLLDAFSEDSTLTQAHSDFVSTVSHEFRTPLTSIKGFADTLLHYGNQLPEDEKRRFISIMKDQADRLIRLVENLLTVSKLGASHLEMSYRPVPLKRLVEKVTHSVQAKMQAKNPQTQCQFSMHMHPDTLEVWADADRLEQILLNLVDNAVKYSPPGTPVSIRGDFLPGDDSQIRIQVQDAGPGIPEALLPRIFTKFYRVETPLKQEVEGTGLGLYITKSLTNAMGGQITAASQPGQGSTFTVTLPAATPERQAMHRRRLYAVDEGEDLRT